MKFSRITFSKKKMGRVPCIRDIGIPVATIVGMVADGMSDNKILAAFPGLEKEDIHEALLFADHLSGNVKSP